MRFENKKKIEVLLRNTLIFCNEMEHHYIFNENVKSLLK